MFGNQKATYEYQCAGECGQLISRETAHPWSYGKLCQSCGNSLNQAATAALGGRGQGGDRPEVRQSWGWL